MARCARSLAAELAALLRDRYGARRVVLTGSLARGEFRRGSDIDLAAAGIADDLFFLAGADLARAAGDIEVDLVPLESTTAAFRARLAEEGIVLHDEGCP
jgi:predicted nucleotidyltransferase